MLSTLICNFCTHSSLFRVVDVVNEDLVCSALFVHEGIRHSAYVRISWKNTATLLPDCNGVVNAAVATCQDT